jgi:hypothetical protein
MNDTNAKSQGRLQVIGPRHNPLPSTPPPPETPPRPMTDRTAPADPREALRRYLDPDGCIHIDNPEDMPEFWRRMEALAARQDEPSPDDDYALREARAVATQQIKAHKAHHTPGTPEWERDTLARQDEPNPALRALVEARDYLASGSSVLNVLAYLNRNIAALAANPPQTREGAHGCRTMPGHYARPRKTCVYCQNTPQTREAEGAAPPKPKMDDDCPDFCSRWPGCGHTEADFLRTPEAQRDTHVPTLCDDQENCNGIIYGMVDHE